MKKNEMSGWLEPLKDLWTSFLHTPLGASLRELLPGQTLWVFLGVVFLMGVVIAVVLLAKSMSDREAKPKKFIKQLIDDKRFQEAGELYLAEGNMEKALSLFVQAKTFSRAARVCEMRGQFEQAGEFYEQARLFQEAIQAYKEAGKVERAAKLLAQEGQKMEAASLFESAGLLSLAATAYQENRQYLDAAKIYLRLEDFEKAGDMYGAELTQQIRSIRGQVTPAQWEFVRTMAGEGAQAYLKGGHKEKAADLYLKGEKYREAANLFQSMGEWDKATEALKKGKMFEEAAQIYEKNGRKSEACRMLGEFYRRKGMLLEAAEHFSKGEDFQAAGELWLQLGEKAKAAEALRQAGEYQDAAALYVQMEDHQHAAVCFEKAGVMAEAAHQYGLAGNAAKRTELLLKAGKFLECGLLYIKEGQVDRAISVLQEIPEESAEFRKAAALLGKLFLEKGMLGVSLKKFQQAVTQQPVKISNLEEYCQIGVIHERTGEFKEAALIYEQILATHYNYADVAARLANVQLEISKVKTGSSDKALHTPTILSTTGDQPDAAGGTKTKQERFELVEEIGRGGMGIVYKARDRILSRIVALKYLPTNFAKNAVAVKNFRREAQSTARLNHAGIVTVYDVGYDSRGNYIAMEYLEGRTVKEHIRQKGALEVETVVTLLRQMAEALEYAHKSKIIHRDVKTSNMLWCENGVVKLMDFGLAKFMQDARNHVTQISGTPYYMSPEQTLGTDIDHRTDIYSLGVSVFEMCTGQVPFRDGDIGYHHIHTPIPDPLERKPGLPRPLRDMIFKCMEKKPEQRYQSAAELVDQIERIQSGLESDSGKKEMSHGTR